MQKKTRYSKDVTLFSTSFEKISDKVEKNKLLLVPAVLAIVSVSPLLLLLQNLDDFTFLLRDFVLLGRSHAGAKGLATLPAVLRHVRAHGLLRPIFNVAQFHAGVPLVARILLVITVGVIRTTMQLFDASLLGENCRHVRRFCQRQFSLEIIVIDLIPAKCERVKNKIKNYLIMSMINDNDFNPSWSRASREYQIGHTGPK